MPRHRNLNQKKFIDSVPDDLLKEYFRRKSNDGKLFELRSHDYNSISNMLESIEDMHLRENILEDFTHINDICEKVMNFLVRAIRRYGIKTTGEEKREELAMRVFLYDKEAFSYAHDRYYLFNSSSKMSHHRIFTENLDLTDEKISRFKEIVRNFYVDLHKGKECIIRHYDEGDSIFIVAIHGSYNRSMSIWQGGKVETRYFRPAHEDVLQYDKKSGLLSIKAPYEREKENYIRAFAEAIAEDKTLAEREDLDTTYTLGPLQDGTFSYYGNEMIKKISLLEVRLKLRGHTSPNIVISSFDVNQTIGGEIREIDLKSGELVNAKFLFILNIEGKKKKVTFEITPPNITDLTRKKYADIIGKYLKENGVKLV